MLISYKTFNISDALNGFTRGGAQGIEQLCSCIPRASVWENSVSTLLPNIDATYTHDVADLQPMNPLSQR